MKNIKRSIWVTAFIGIFVAGAFAIDVVPASEQMAKEIVEKAWNEEGESLPREIKSAVIAKYVAYAIDDVTESDTDTYKIVLKNNQNKLIVYYSKTGEYLRQEVVKPVQVVAILNFK